MTHSLHLNSFTVIECSWTCLENSHFPFDSLPQRSQVYNTLLLWISSIYKSLKFCFTFLLLPCIQIFYRQNYSLSITILLTTFMNTTKTSFLLFSVEKLATKKVKHPTSFQFVTNTPYLVTKSKNINNLTEDTTVSALSPIQSH